MIKVKEIVLTLDSGQDIKLTLQEARDLSQQLQALFGDNQFPAQPLYPPSYPPAYPPAYPNLPHTPVAPYQPIQPVSPYPIIMCYKDTINSVDASFVN